MKKFKTWLGSLFNKSRKSRVTLDKFDVERVEEMINNYDMGIVMKYFDISKSTYRNIKSGKHRYSKK